MLEGVDYQVAQDAFDPPGIDLGDTRGPRRDQLKAAPPLGQWRGRLNDARYQVVDIDGFQLEQGSTSVDSTDLEQVAQQRLEPVELGL